jgi:hypothetical protein
MFGQYKNLCLPDVGTEVYAFFNALVVRREASVR